MLEGLDEDIPEARLGLRLAVGIFPVSYTHLDVYKRQDIALQVGFECVRTFYRAFKRYYGVTPSQYTRARG